MNFALPKVLITLLLKFLVVLFACGTYPFVCWSCIPLPNAGILVVHGGESTLFAY